MDVTQYIPPALERFGDATNISDDDFADFLKFTPDDKKAMHELMSLLFANKWLFLSPDVVTLIISTPNREGMRRFVKEKLCAKNQYGIDYVKITRNGRLLDENDAETTKYRIKYDIPNLTESTARNFYLVSPYCMQRLIMDARTPLGDMARKCSAQLNLLHTLKEEFLKCTKERALQLQIERLERRVIAAEVSNAQLHATIRAQKPIAQEWIYIATSPSLAAKNYFKPGRTESLRARLTNYNSSHPSTDRMYFAFAQRCAFPKQVEQLIKIATAQFADTNDPNKEMRQMPFAALKCIVRTFVDADASALATICESIDHFDAQAHVENSAPEPCNIDQLEPRLQQQPTSDKTNAEYIRNCVAQIFAELRIDTSYNIKSAEATKCKDIIIQNKHVMHVLSLRANMTVTTLINRVIETSEYRIKIATITVKSESGSTKETNFVIQRKTDIK